MKNERVMTMRRIDRDERVSALRDGRKVRSVTFTDRKKKANKKACRGKVQW